MAATRGARGRDVVLRSDAEGLALLGVTEDTPLLADVLRWQGSVLRERGQTAEAEELYNRSLKVAQDHDYLAGQSHAVNCLGAIAQRRGEMHRAKQLFQAAHRMAEGCGDLQLAGMIQQNRGVVDDISGDFESAAAHYRSSLKAFETTKDTRSMTLVLNNLGLLQFRTGRYDEARKSYDQALSIARTRGDLLSEGVIEQNVAELEMQRGDLSAANESIARALEIASLRQDSLRRAAGLKLLGACLRLGGCGKDAIEPLTGALALSEAGEDVLLSGEILFECGMAHKECGDTAAARDCWERARVAFERIGAAAMLERTQTEIDGLGARG